MMLWYTILVSTSIIADVTAVTQAKNTVIFVFQAWKVSGIMNDDQKLLERVGFELLPEPSVKGE